MNRAVMTVVNVRGDMIAIGGGDVLLGRTEVTLVGGDGQLVVSPWKGPLPTAGERFEMELRKWES